MTARRIVENHVELENVGELLHEEIDAALTSSSLITVSGESTLSGSRTLTAGSNITIQDNGPGSTIVISSTAAGGSGLRPYVFSVPQGVPNAGAIRYLNMNEIPTSLIPIHVQTAFVLKNAYISVPTTDASRGYDLKVRVSGTLGDTTQTIYLESGSAYAAALNIDLSASANSTLQLWTQRVSGSGKSTFNYINAAVELS